MSELEKQIWAKSVYPREIVKASELTQKGRQDLGAINLAITLPDIHAILDEARQDFPCDESLWKYRFGLDEDLDLSQQQIREVIAWYVRWFIGEGV
jgi:hypothetical protein